MDIREASDTMLLVTFEQAIDPAINDRVIQLAARLQARLGAAVRDIVPAYCAIGVHYDPLLADRAAIERAIREESRGNEQGAQDAARPVREIVVRYGGVDGPDLEAVAAWAGCSPADVVERHAARIYRVYMLGFVPGFAYMGRVDASIAAPRHRVPRDRVPAGSVGIAGEQTGIYPIVTPGGWQLIGRTDVTLFDPLRPQPSLLQAGELVRFVPVP